MLRIDLNNKNNNKSSALIEAGIFELMSYLEKRQKYKPKL